MEISEFAKSLGVPGLLIGVWYLLELAKNKRQEKADERHAAIEQAKVAAMAQGFTILLEKIDEHMRTDLQSHTVMVAEVTELRGMVVGAEIERERTPPAGIRMPREQVRAKTVRKRTNPLGVPALPDQGRDDD